MMPQSLNIGDQSKKSENILNALAEALATAPTHGWCSSSPDQAGVSPESLLRPDGRDNG